MTADEDRKHTEEGARLANVLMDAARELAAEHDYTRGDLDALLDQAADDR